MAGFDLLMRAYPRAAAPALLHRTLAAAIFEPPLRLLFVQVAESVIGTQPHHVDDAEYPEVRDDPKRRPPGYS